MTGDLVTRDADGYYTFVSRKKDIIRRRGENIAGAEIDRVIQSHPGVFEVAAVPVPSELGEDEILVAIVPKPGVTLTAAGNRAVVRGAPDRDEGAALRAVRQTTAAHADPQGRQARSEVRHDAQGEGRGFAVKRPAPRALVSFQPDSPNSRCSHSGRIRPLAR